MRLSQELLNLCSKTLGVEICMTSENFKEHTFLRYEDDLSESEILDILSTSSLRYYYASFNREDFFNKLNNLNSGYKNILMNPISVYIDNSKILYICLY